MIRGHGISPIKGFFVADAGQGDDLKSELALSGYQYTLLRQLCAEQKLDADHFYKTCLIKEEPKQKPVKVKADFYISENKELIARYGPILIGEINELRPDLIIPLGELSFNFLTNLRSIRKFRGSVLAPSGQFVINKPNTKIMPILGPYPYLYNEPRLKFISRVDFGKIGKYLNDRPIPDNYYKIWTATSAAALRAFLDRSYKDDGLLVFDIETFAGIPTCGSLCFDGFESVCVPFLDQTIDLDNRVLMVDLFARILNSKIPKVNQNIKYDWKQTERWGFHVNNVVGDTMLAASCLYCEFPKNLGFLTSIYTDLPYFKDENSKEFDPTRYKKERFYNYNAKDSLATHQIFKKQQEEVDELGVRFVYNSTIKLMPIYRRMEERGLRVDEHQRGRLLGKYWNLFEIETMKLRKTAGNNTLNPLSSPQMRKLVYDEIGYKPVKGCKFTESGEPKADEDNLALLKIFGEAKRAPSTGPLVLEAIIGCRKFHKVIEILELDLWPDKRFRCEFNLAGAETGRSTAGESTDQLLYIDPKTKKISIKLGNLGHSLQTIGKHGFVIDGETYGRDVRSMYVASPGFSLVELDLAGAEARVDAVLAGIFDLSYFSNPGIHKLTGSWCFDCKPNEIKKGVLVPFGGQFIDRYHVAKQVRHAGERNITAGGLVTKLLWGFSEADGAFLLKKFHAKQPEIRGVYHHDIIKAINETRCLRSPNGRRRDFFDRVDQSTYNEGFSQLPQAIVADQTKFEGVLKTAPLWPQCFLLSEAHDGTLWEVPKGQELDFMASYKNNIESGIDFRHCTLKRDYELHIPCEGAVGENWYEMEEVKL